MKTYSAKSSEITRKWYIVDASELPLGRLLTVVATYLGGKHKPMYTPNIDCGDFIIIINARKAVFTGNKLKSKKYYSYSGYPGGLKTTTLDEKLAKDPISVIELAVKGMLPKNKLVAGRLARLKIFDGSEHTHQAQQPTKLEFKRTKADKGADNG